MIDLATKRCIPSKDILHLLKGRQLHFLYNKLSIGWKIIAEHHLEKKFKFPDLGGMLAFANSIYNLADEQKQDPQLFLSWKIVKLSIWSHKIEGLSETDFIFASKIDTYILPMIKTSQNSYLD